MTLPITSAVSTPQRNVFTTNPLQIGGVQASTINLTYVAFTGTQDRNFSLGLSGFPTSISLASGATATIIASVTLASRPPQGTPIFSIPQLQLVIGSGSPNQVPNSGQATFNLQSGRVYTNLSLSGTIRAYSPTAVAQQIVTFNVTALLVGASS